MTDKHSITTAERLREVVGAEIPGLAEKNQDRLNEFAIDFLSRCPFLVHAKQAPPCLVPRLKGQRMSMSTARVSMNAPTAR